MKTVTLKIPDGLDVKIRRALTRRKENFSDLARRALASEVEEGDLDFAKLAAPYRGMFKGPANLSSREGYGAKKANFTLTAHTYACTSLYPATRRNWPGVPNGWRRLKKEQGEPRQNQSDPPDARAQLPAAHRALGEVHPLAQGCNSSPALTTNPTSPPCATL